MTVFFVSPCINFVNFWNKCKISGKYQRTTHLLQVASPFFVLFQWFGMLQVREMRFYYANGLHGGSKHLRTFRRSIGCKKCILLAEMLLFHSCVFTHSIYQGWANLFNRRVIFRNQKHQRAAKPVWSVNTKMVKNAIFILIDAQ